MKKWISGIVFAGVVISVLLLCLQYKNDNHVSKVSYVNPVFEPVFADPSTLRTKDGYVYAYGTEDDWGDGEGAKVVPTIRSKNMVNWEYVGEAFTEKPSWKSGSVWAPDISYYDGKYYLYYTLSEWGDPNPGIGVAVSNNTEGPFTDHGKLFTSEEMDVYSIDPMLVVEKGKPYLFFGSIEAGTFGIELSPDGFSTIGDKFQISGSGYEAPYIFKKVGYYYFFGSSGTCCDGKNSTYRVAVGRSKSIKGPYQNKEGQDLMYSEGNVILAGPFLAQKGTEHFVGPGHNSIITDDNGTEWIVYHAIDRNDPKLSNGATRRPLMMDPIKWSDGWPEIKESVPSTGKMSGPVFHEDIK